MSIIRREGKATSICVFFNVFQYHFDPSNYLLFLCKYDDFFWVVYCAQAFQEMQVAKITQIVKLCNLKSL